LSAVNVDQRQIYVLLQLCVTLLVPKLSV